MTTFSVNMIPMFFVPLFILLHMLAFKADQGGSGVAGESWSDRCEKVLQLPYKRSFFDVCMATAGKKVNVNSKDLTLGAFRLQDNPITNSLQISSVCTRSSCPNADARREMRGWNALPSSGAPRGSHHFFDRRTSELLIIYYSRKRPWQNCRLRCKEEKH